MKRRTRSNENTRPLNHDLHRLAFEHAKAILPARKFRQRSGRTFRFEVELMLEEGRSANLTLTNTRGFRFQLEPAQNWQNPSQKHDKLALHKPHRLLKVRLKQYRTLLHDWQKSTPHPLTFRHFNLLLAALCYDVSANL